MSYLVLARKYRPMTFDEVVGQQGVVQTLKNAIALGRVAHAYLFTGARGVGKTTVARILAKALNCEKGPTAEPDNSCTQCSEIARGASPDVFEIDGASNTGVDDVRQLRDNSQYLPARSRFKIYIIDEVHMLSTSAFNALLKTLEEPPPHVKFIFATTEPHKIPVTVLSRCQRFDFKRIPTREIEDHLRSVIGREGLTCEPDALRLLARQAGGSMRDALSLTDQVLAFGGESITAVQVREALGLADAAVFEQAVEGLLAGSADELMAMVERLFDEGHDLRRFLEGLLWHVHRLILFRSLQKPDELVDLLPEERERLRTQAARADALRWHQVFDVLSRAAEEIARHPFPRLVVETTLLRLAAVEPIVGLDALVARVEDLARRLGEPAGARSPGGGGGRRAADERPATAPGGGFTPPRRAAEPSAPAAQPARPATPPVRPSEPVAPSATPPPACSSAGGAAGPESWERLVEFVNGKRPSLGSCLTHACVREIVPGKVRLAIEKGSFFSDQIRADRNRRDLERFLAEFFGAPTKLLVEDLTGETGPTLAQQRERALQASAEDIKREALADPMVQEAIRVFGAEVEQVRSDRGGREG